MLTVEIANLVELKKAIIISSVKTVIELPWIFKVYRLIPLYRLLSEKQYGFLTAIAKPFFGKFSRAEWLLFKDMFNHTPAAFMKWAIKAILNWNNTKMPTNLCHIAGNKDLIFKHLRIKKAHIVEGGTHMMVFDKAPEINRLIQTCLNK